MIRPASDWGGNIVAFGLMIALNAMATSIPLGGQTPPEISANYPSLFTPAGFTFSIWGLIYLGLLLFVIYQALPAQRTNATLARLSGLFKVNCVANAAWILAWHYDFLLLSVLIMLCILATLIRIYRILHKRQTTASPLECIVTHLPFRIYTAWICVATIANISTVQTALGWDDVGTDAINWALLKLALAGAVGATVIARKNDIAFILVVAWAAFGISVKQVETPAVAGAAFSLCALALILAVFESARFRAGEKRVAAAD
ncbi:MAG: tryptophan-rich sensory protein [Pseudomonadales bacterium]|nr:tryptophan-rich sensory protein [Halioglobus sp.]MCP5128763.1 tryptophan-rich sensory protein [Pseudomonadales bacterium]